MPKKIDVPIGTRFGKWTTTSEKYKINGKSHYHVDVVCDCGSTLTIYSGLLTSGAATKCWKCYNGTRPTLLSPREVVTNNVYGSYIKSAKRRGIAFTLTKDEFQQLIFQNCFYCGVTPKNIVKDRVEKPRLLPKYSGVDRRDNSVGYLNTNVVPCCRWCNEAKRAKTEVEFLEWVERLSNVTCGGGYRAQTRRL